MNPLHRRFLRWHLHRQVAVIRDGAPDVPDAGAGPPPDNLDELRARLEYLLALPADPELLRRLVESAIDIGAGLDHYPLAYLLSDLAAELERPTALGAGPAMEEALGPAGDGKRKIALVMRGWLVPAKLADLDRWIGRSQPPRAAVREAARTTALLGREVCRRLLTHRDFGGTEECLVRLRIRLESTAERDWDAVAGLLREEGGAPSAPP